MASRANCICFFLCFHFYISPVLAVLPFCWLLLSSILWLDVFRLHYYKLYIPIFTCMFRVEKNWINRNWVWVCAKLSSKWTRKHKHTQHSGHKYALIVIKRMQEKQRERKRVKVVSTRVQTCIIKYKSYDWVRELIVGNVHTLHSAHYVCATCTSGCQQLFGTEHTRPHTRTWHMKLIITHTQILTKRENQRVHSLWSLKWKQPRKL